MGQESETVGRTLRRGDGPGRRALQCVGVLRPGAGPVRHPRLHRPRADAGERGAAGGGRRRSPGPGSGVAGAGDRGGGVPLRSLPGRHSHEHRGAAPGAGGKRGGTAPRRAQSQRSGGDGPGPLPAGHLRRGPARAPRSCRASSSPALASTSTRCFPATPTCNEPSRCDWPTTGSPSWRCSPETASASASSTRGSRRLPPWVPAPWRGRPSRSTGSTRPRRWGSRLRRPIAWTRWPPEIVPSSSSVPRPSPWCISRAWPRSWCSGRARSSASSSWRTPTPPARA